MFCSVDSSPIMTDCTISNNVARGDGGAISCCEGGPTIANCAFVGNSAACGAAMFCCCYCIPTITSCTMAANSAVAGRALACSSDGYPSQVELIDCILWDGGDEVWNGNNSTITIAYSDVWGGWPGEGNIDADPLFVSGPLGDHYLSQTAAGQPVNRPCVDAGSDTAENLGLDTRTTRTDQVGDAGIVDMGYHYPIECVGDLDGDNDTDQADLGILLADWGCDDPVNGCAGDLNGDDRTDQADLGILLADWGCTN